MASQLTCRFPRRHNGDGSHDSICISCFATVASVRNVTELAQHEQDHACEMTLLNHIGQSCRLQSDHSRDKADRCQARIWENGQLQP
jgi:hypothetical protein